MIYYQVLNQNNSVQDNGLVYSRDEAPFKISRTNYIGFRCPLRTLVVFTFQAHAFEKIPSALGQHAVPKQCGLEKLQIEDRKRYSPTQKINKENATGFNTWSDTTLNWERL